MLHGGGGIDPHVGCRGIHGLAARGRPVEHRLHRAVSGAR